MNAISDIFKDYKDISSLKRIPFIKIIEKYKTICSYCPAIDEATNKTLTNAK